MLQLSSDKHLAGHHGMMPVGGHGPQNGVENGADAEAGLCPLQPLAAFLSLKRRKYKNKNVLIFYNKFASTMFRIKILFRKKQNPFIYVNF